MVKDLRNWGAPDEALKKSNLLPNAAQQKYLSEVQKRFEAYTVQEHQESAINAEEKSYIKDPLAGTEDDQLPNFQFCAAGTPI